MVTSSTRWDISSSRLSASLRRASAVRACARASASCRLVLRGVPTSAWPRASSRSPSSSATRVRSPSTSKLAASAASARRVSPSSRARVAAASERASSAACFSSAPACRSWESSARSFSSSASALLVGFRRLSMDVPPPPPSFMDSSSFALSPSTTALVSLRSWALRAATAASAARWSFSRVVRSFSASTCALSASTSSPLCLSTCPTSPSRFLKAWASPRSTCASFSAASRAASASRTRS
mmetsp:Transcript_20508/g.65109  ORF Transcript_20508/g.65109 Transcript_20508/m.65109 type:complete len:241 (-) Transcript_20508:455-1177(-)